MDAARQPEVDYQWPEKWAERARRITQSLTAVKPVGVSFYMDEALPWVVVWYDEAEIVMPAQALAAGQAIQSATEKTVFFHGLRPSSALYILDDRSEQKGSAPRLGPEEYAVPFEDLKSAWGDSTGSLR